jgi:acetyl-CoA C-acetyltransferase
MRFERSFIPVGGGWSSPFARWQGAFSDIVSYDLAVSVAGQALADRGVAPEDLSSLVLGWTVPQERAFGAPAGIAAALGAPNITGPLVMQSCATGAYVVATAAATVESGEDGIHLALATDRISNGPLLVFPRPSHQGGGPATWHWVLDNFQHGEQWLLGQREALMLQTAEIVAEDAGVTREEIDEVTLLRYEQYERALENDRAFQRRYMIPVEVPQRRGDPVVVQTDVGVHSTSKEKLSKLKPVDEGGTHTHGAQTHPADGTAGLLVTSEDRARAMSDGEGSVQLLAAGFARAAPGHMPAAPVPAAERALASAGLTFKDVDAVTTHNPFTINDIWFSRQTGIPVEEMNSYGSSLVFGHPHAATGIRLVVELIETLRLRGGGVGLFTGCAAGDSGGAIVLRVGD